MTDITKTEKESNTDCSRLYMIRTGYLIAIDRTYGESLQNGPRIPLTQSENDSPYLGIEMAQ